MMIRQLICLSIIFGFAASHAVSSEHSPSARLYYGIETETALESSLLSTAVAKVAKTAWVFFYTLWTIAEYKFSLIGYGIRIALWFTKHFFSLIVGATIMFGFCKLSGLCSTHYLPQGILQLVPSDQLAQAQRTFNEAVDTYGRIN